MRKSLKYSLLSVALILCVVLGVKGYILQVASGTWAAQAGLTQARSGASAVLLQDGRIFVTGGDGAAGTLASAEIIGADGTSSPAASMSATRSRHVSAVLANDTVLVAGGTTSGGGAINTAEIYDPVSNSWTTVAGVMVEARSNATAAVLQDGRVLITGGDKSGVASSTIEIFDPTAQTFSFAGALSSPRTEQAMALLADGRLFIAGGSNGSVALNTTDIYDPVAGSVSAGPALSTRRMGHSATTMLDGRVLIAGGNNGTADLASAEIFDPVAGTFTPVGSSLSTARQGHLAFLLPNNNTVLIVGGTSAGVPLGSAEVFTPWLGTFAPTGSLTVARSNSAGSPMKQDGLLAVAGGQDASGVALGNMDLYGFATVKTDASDYPPGTTVNITGSGWQPGETVTLTLVESPLIDTHGPYTVVADANGRISNSSFVTDDHDLSISFYLTAVGSQSQAQNTFKDNKNLTITFAGNGAGSVAVSGSTVAANPTNCPSSTNPCVVPAKETDTGTLAATANSGSVFAGWSAQTSGITSCGSNTCNFSMNSVAQSVTATFKLNKLAITSVNGGSNPTAGTAFSVIVQSQDGNGNPLNVAANTGVVLSRNTGTGTLGGTLTGTILAGTNSIAISGVTYTKAESGVVLTATKTSGDTLAAGNSSAFTVNPGAASAGTSTVIASPTTVVADGSTISTITATILDANSNPVSGKAISLTAGSGSSTITTLSGTTNAGGQATFSVKDAVVENVTYTAKDTTDNVTITQTAAVNFSAGTVSATASTVSANPTSVTADGTTTSTITVTLLDGSSHPVSVKTVSLTAGSGSSTITTVSGTTNASGQATFTVKDAVAQSVTYTAKDTTDNITVTQAATVNFTAGAVGAATSTVSANPTSVTADGTTTSTITVTLKDANSNPVSAKTVSLTAGGGSSTITTVSGTTNASGQASFTVKDTAVESVTYTGKDTTDNITVTQTATVSFTAGAVSAATSTVSANPTSVTADGVTTSTITATLLDASSHAVSGKAVSLTAGSGSSTITTVSGTTNASGQATFTVKDVVAQSVTYTAKDTTDNITVTATATVNFTVGAVNAGKSTVIANPTSVTADNSSTSAITVTLLDANSNPVSGKTVSLAAATGSSTITTVSGTTNVSGQASFTVKDAVAESIIFTAKDTTDNVTVSQTATVTFTAGAVAKFVISTISSPQTAGTAFNITITAEDASNNIVTGFGSSSNNKVMLTSNGALVGAPITTAQFANGLLGTNVTITNTGSFTITATGIAGNSGITGTSNNFTVNPGAVSAATSTITGTTPVTANGTSTSAITITLKDANSNAVPGLIPTFSASGFNNTYGVCSTSNATGVSNCALASTTAEIKTLSIVTPVAVTGGAVTFTAGAPVAANSTIIGTSGITANGTATSTITITLKDVNSNPVSGVTPTFAATGSNNTYGPCSASNTSGVSTCTLASTKAETKTLSIVTPVPATGGTVTFIAGALASLSLSPASATISAGGSQTYAAQGLDSFNNPTGDVTAGTTFTITPDGSCTGTICTASAAGPHTVTGTDSGKTGTASLQVNAGAVASLLLTPATSTIAAGGSQTYAAQGLDSFNNPTGDVTGGTTFTIAPDGSCTLAVCSASIAGTHAVTGTYSTSAKGGATLMVNAGAFTKLQVLVPGETAAPGTTSGKTGTPSLEYVNGAFNVTMNAVDDNWNVVGSVNDMVQTTSNDTKAVLPSSAVALSSGTGTFSVMLETVANPAATTVTASDTTDGTKAAGTSAAIEVVVAYTASISPTTAANNLGTTYTLTVKNGDTPNPNNLKSMSVAIPTNGGMPTGVTVAAISSGTTAANWMADTNAPAGFLRFRECVNGDACYTSGSNDVAPGGSITIQFTTTANESITTAALNEIWNTTAFSDVANGTALPLAGPEPTVAIGAGATFKSANNATFTNGTAGSFTVLTTGGVPTPTLSESGAPPTGVTFTDNGDGTATIAGTPNVAGTFPLMITAHNGYGADASQSFTLTVNTESTTTAVVSSSNPSFSGQQVIFTATVSAAGGALTGTVQFQDNGQNLGSAVTLVSNTAQLQTSALSVGTHPITAVYSGNTNFASSTSNSVSQIVNSAQTTTTVTSSANPSTFGGAVSFTAKVAASQAGLSTWPSGTVQFSIDGTAFGSPVTVVSGNASSGTVSSLTAGSHSISAVYSGDSNFLTSTGSLSQTVSKADQTITFTTNAPQMATFNSGFTVAATASSGLAVSFSNTGVCSNVGPAFTMTSGTGTCTVKADQAGNSNYNAAPEVTQNTTAQKASQTITFTGAPATAQFGSTFSVTASASSGLAVTLGASGACSITGNVVSMTSGTGVCLLTADQVGDTNFSAAAQAKQSSLAMQAPATVVLSNLSQIYDGTPKVVSIITAPMGLNVAVTYDGSANAPTNAKSYAVVATIMDANYAGFTTGTLTIQQAQPVITWSNPADITFGTALSSVQLNATAAIGTANIPGTFTYAPPAGTILSAGNGQSLTADFAPTDSTNYAQVNGTHVVINVKAAPLYVVSSDGSRAFGQNNPQFTPTFIGLTDGDTPTTVGTVTCNSTAVTTSAPGTYAATCSGVNSSNYTVTYIAGTLSVTNPLNAVTVTNGASANSETLMIGQTDTLTATGTFTDGSTRALAVAGGTSYGKSPLSTAVSGAAMAEAGGVLYAIGGFDGSNALTTIQAYDPKNDSWSTSSAVLVTARTNAAVASVAGKIYVIGGKNASGVALGSIEIVDTTGTTPSVSAYPTALSRARSGAGAAAFNNKIYVIGGSDNSNHALSSVEIFDFVTGVGSHDDVGAGVALSQASAAVVTTNNLAKLYVAGVSGSSVVLKSFDGANWSAAISNSLAGANGVGAAALGGQLYLVNGADVWSYDGTAFVKKNSLGNAHNGTQPVSVGSLIYAGSVGSGAANSYLDAFAADEVKWTSADATKATVDQSGKITAIAITSPGTVAITATSLNNPAISAQFQLTIIKKTQTIQFAALGGKTYGDADFSISASSLDSTSTATGLLVGFTAGASDSCTVGASTLTAGVSSATVHITGAGSCTITAAQPGDDTTWMAATSVPRTFAIAKAALSVTAADASRYYGANNATFTGMITGIKNGDNITATYASVATAASPVGTYPIVPTLVDPGIKLGNYNITSTNGILTVKAVAITVTADAQTKVYGYNDPALTYKVTTGTLVNGDSFTGALSRAAGTSVGTYAITQGTLALSTNYTLTFVGANLVITPRPITVTADSQTKVYGYNDPPLTYKVTGTLVTGDSFSGVLSRVSGENVGTYTISQGSLTLSTNYTLTFVGANFVITARPITVTAYPETKVFGSVDPSPLIYKVTGTLVTGDSFTGFLTRVSGEDAGTYAILQGSLVLSANYNLSYVGANFTITQATPVVIAAGGTFAYNGNAETGSGLATGVHNEVLIPVMLAYFDASNNALTSAPVNAGNYTVVATFAGSHNYTANSSAPAAIVITAIPLFIEANYKTRAANATDPTFDAAYVGLTNGETSQSSSLSGTLICISNASGNAPGHYAITCSGVTSVDYNITYVPGVLTITNPITAIAVNPANPSVPVFSSQAFTATGTFADGTSRSLNSGGGTWSSVTGMPTPVSGAAVGLINGVIYVAGGSNGGAATDSTEAYDITNNNWTAKHAMLAPRSASFSSNGAVINGKLYVVGGSASGGCSSANEVYDPGSDSWTSLAAMPTARCDLAVVAANGHLYAIGGTNTGGSPQYSTVESYDPATNAWTTKASLPSGLTALSAAVVNGKIYVMGGLSSSGYANTNEVYDPSSDSWAPKANMPSARFGLSSCAEDGVIYAIGGQDSTGSLSTVEAYNPLSDSWTTKAAAPQAIEATEVVPGNGVLYVAGGIVSGTAVPSLQTYTPDDIAWTSGTTSVSIIDATGNAAALVPGTSTITASSLIVPTVQGNTLLTVIQATPVFSTLSSATIGYGTASTTLSGKLALGTHIPTGSVSITVNGVTQSAAIAADGSFTSTFTTNSFGVSSSPYVITYSYAGDTLFASASDTSKTLTVTPANLTITANAQTKVYGVADPALTYKITSGTLFNGDTLTGALARTSGETVAGSPYAISQGTLIVNSNYMIHFTGNALTITPATLTVTANPQTKTYGQVDPALTYAASGFQLGDTVAVLSGGLTRIAGETVAGSPYAIGQGTLVANSNYTIHFTASVLTITPATLTVTANPQTKIYGQGDPALTYASSGFQLSDSVAVLSGALVRASGEMVAGSPYAISQGTLVANSNYTIHFTGNALTITPATLTVTANPQTKIYGQVEPALTYAASGFQLSDTVAVLSGALVRASGEMVAGSPYAISQGTLTSNSNYTIHFTGNALTITPATLTVTANPQTKIYGQVDPALTYAASGFQLGDTVAVLSGGLTRIAGETVAGSPYAISQGTLVSNSNYSIHFTASVFTITPKAASVTAAAAGKTYGTADPGFSGTLSGFLAADNVTASYARTTGETVAGSPYTISATLAPAAVLGNYNITYNTATFTINKATASVTPAAANKTYGTADPAFSGTLTGFVSTDSVTATYARTTGETVAGSPYTISATLAPAAVLGNYSITYNTAGFTISPAPLKITASSGTMTYGGPVFMVAAIYSGFVNGDTASSLTPAATCGTSANSASSAGTYPSFCASAQDNNYVISYVAGTVTVMQATTATAVVSSSPNNSSTYMQLVTFTATVTPQYAGTTPTGTVTFYNNGASIGTGMLSTTSCGTLPCADQATLSISSLPDSGPDNITAVYGGDGNFVPSNSPAIIQTVQPAPNVSLSPMSVSFGNQNVNTSSKPAVVTLSNIGDATLNISSNGISISPNTDFTQTNTCGATVLAGNSCTISITFTPVDTGIRTASLQITDNDDDAVAAQQTVALTGSGLSTIPGTSLFTDAVFATANGCGSIIMSGGSTVDSFNSAQGYTSTHAQSGGNVGTNGNVTLNGSKSAIYGSVAASSPSTGNCSKSSVTGVTTSGGAQVTGPVTAVNGSISYPNPPAPNPAPPTTSQNISGSCGSVSGCSNTGSKMVRLVPGQYGNLNISGGTTAHFSQGIYNINSLTLSGQSILHVDSGPIVINLAGASLSGGNAAMDANGGSIENPTLSPENLQITYAGSRGLNLTGGAASYATVYAPNALVNMSGGADFFGSIIASTITNSGGTAIHYDWSLPGMASGNYIWFNAVANNVQGLPSNGAQVKLYLTNSSISFWANGTNYVVPVPNAVVTFNSASMQTSAAKTTYDPINSRWSTAVGKAALTGNTFVTGVAFQVPSNFPTGIQNVAWSASYSTDTPGITLQWQWGAAVYNSFSSTYATSTTPPNTNFLGVNAEDGVPGSDPAGTPETYKSSVIFGATGGGGTNYTGYFSAAAGIVPTVAPMSVSPSSLGFGTQNQGSTSLPMSVTLTNNDGIAHTIASIGAGGANASEFKVTNNCPISPSTLAAGSNCTITVTFTPGDVGTRTAKVAVNDDAKNSPQTVYLSGTGQ